MAKKSLRMRRLLSGVLSAVMLATLVPSTAFAIGKADTGSFLTGPYLMTPKTNGMVVVWELDKPMKSTITYGTSDADKKTLEVPVEEGEKFKGESMHMYRARLTDLTPGTTYTYKVETEDGQTVEGHFRTLPENSDEIRFVVVSDSHRFETATKVSDVVAQFDPDFILHTGDMVEGTGSQKDHPRTGSRMSARSCTKCRLPTTAATTITVSTLMSMSPRCRRSSISPTRPDAT